MPRLALDGAEIDYEVVGEGPVALTLHGLGSSRGNDLGLGFDWTPTLSETHQVVSYDARGHGRSTGRAEPADYRWERLADDLLALADRFSPDAPVDAVGSSMGSGTLLHAVLRAPERFRRLVLVIPPTAWATREAQGDAQRDSADIVEQQGLDRFVRLARKVPMAPALEGRERPVPDVPEELMPSVLRGATMTDLPEPPAISSIGQPTLILAWTEDAGHPLSTADLLADLLPHATLRVAGTPDELAEWPALAAKHLAD